MFYATCLLFILSCFWDRLGGFSTSRKPNITYNNLSFFPFKVFNLPQFCSPFVVGVLTFIFHKLEQACDPGCSIFYAEPVLYVCQLVIIHDSYCIWCVFLLYFSVYLNIFNLFFFLSEFMKSVRSKFKVLVSEFIIAKPSIGYSKSPSLF